MTAKQYLQRAWYVNRRIQRIREQIEQMEALVYSGRRPKLTGLPRGARGDWTDVVDRLDEYTRSRTPSPPSRTTTSGTCSRTGI